MQNLSAINVLFFDAKKIFYNPIGRYLVEGYPNNTSVKVSYNPFLRDFYFRTYKEVVTAGILWTKRLYGVNTINDLYIKNLEYGRKKQWFDTQLVQTGNGITIDGENFNPFVNISYSYNAVTKVKFEIGFYRSACSNGMVIGYKELAKLEIKPEFLFDIPFWINPCLIQFLTKRLDFQFRILKKTHITRKQILEWLTKNTSKWKISTEMSNNYIEHLGENAYSLLNILTDSASDFELKNDRPLIYSEVLDHEIDDASSNSERTTRQRRVGIFLESLISEILRQNSLDSGHDIINTPEFSINDEQLKFIQTNRLPETFRINMLKIEF